MPPLPFKPIPRIVESVIPVECAGMSLLDYLSQRYDYLQRHQWQEQLEMGKLQIDDRLVTCNQLLPLGAVLHFDALGLEEQEVDWDIQLLHEDDNTIIVNKPGNLPCHPAGRFFNHTLWAWLIQCRGLAQAHFVNRLDRETSGIVMVAKNSRFAAKAAKALQRLDQQQLVAKEYSVVVHGRVPQDSFTATGWLDFDAASQVRKKRRFTPAIDPTAPPPDSRAQSCSTSFQCRGYCRPTLDGAFQMDPAGEFTLLNAQLHTGRTHQIRATLCSLGYPVVGDKIYGVDDTLYLRFIDNTLTPQDLQRLILPRQALHARSLSIPELEIAVQAPPPFIRNQHSSESQI